MIPVPAPTPGGSAGGATGSPLSSVVKERVVMVAIPVANAPHMAMK